MKGFTREETRFSLCGLNCALCSMCLGGYCPGCGGGAGNQSCAIAKCSLQHGGVQFCWECSEYPCSRYEGFNDGDSFVPHRNRQQDIALAREIGLEAYLTQLEEKRAILDERTSGPLQRWPPQNAFQYSNIRILGSNPTAFICFTNRSIGIKMAAVSILTRHSSQSTCLPPYRMEESVQQ